MHRVLAARAMAHDDDGCGRGFRDRPSDIVDGLAYLFDLEQTTVNMIFERAQRA